MATEHMDQPEEIASKVIRRAQVSKVLQRLWCPSMAVQMLIFVSR